MEKTWSANQLVAYNLRRARREAGLTQKEAGARLGHYLEKPWSVASFSAAESTAKNGARTRLFSADEILAFARVFEQPIAYFFTPPEESQERRPINCGGVQVVELRELLDAIETIPGPRLRLLYTGLSESDRADFDRVLRRNVLDRLESPSVRNVTEHAANLRRLANALEAADDRVQGVFADELDHAFGKEENDAKS
jgi:transcriptional regulator with XRE-family HTH domain